MLVDELMLGKGIYTSSKPYLMAETATIDDIKRYAEILNMTTNPPFYPIEYFDNLEKCELVDVTVIVHEKSDEK